MIGCWEGFLIRAFDGLLFVFVNGRVYAWIGIPKAQLSSPELYAFQVIFSDD